MTRPPIGTRILLALVPLFLLLAPAHSEGSGTVSENEPTIADIRARHEDEIMAIDGVVSVGTGVDRNGNPCLKIGTSGPTEDVRAKLPDAVKRVRHEIERIGDIEAQ